MDTLGALLEGPRARGAFLLKVTMRPPWSLSIQDAAPLTVVAVTGGSACYTPPDEAAVRLDAGDLLLIARPTPYRFADHPDRPPQAVIHPGGRCETLAGPSLELPTDQGVRTWGNCASGPDVMLVGTYPDVGEVAARLIRSLPPAWVLRSGEDRSGLIDVLGREIGEEGLGQASLLDRLLDGLTVTAIRHWARSRDPEQQGWLGAADRDPAVGAALELINEHPDHPWDVASLAASVGMSRAGFSRRFSTVVGTSPVAHLTGWRLALAADRLRLDDTPVGRVAAEVGYTSPFTFSAAFKRRYGCSPLAYRRGGSD